MTLPSTVVAALQRTIGPRVLTDPVDMVAYSYDGTFLVRRPAAVVVVESVDEVVGVVALAAREGFHLLARGSGTSLTGGPVPLGDDEVVVDLTRLNRLYIDPVDMTATVEAGVVTGDLARAAAERGLFYPPDPASLAVSTIGGNLACNAGGPSGLKYGATRDYVLALEVVLAPGRRVWLGSRTMKNASGYPLHQLFVGAEGTLGIIVRAVLKLLPRPASERTVLVGFTSLEAAAGAVTRVLGTGLLPAAIELVDGVCLDAVTAYHPLQLPAGVEAVLLFRLDGHPVATAAEVEGVATACREAGATLVRVAASAVEADELWVIRRAISPALARLRPNKLGEDIAVPRSAIVTMVQRIQEISAAYRVPIATFGHISDGNLHPNILFDATDPDERERMLGAAAAIVDAALALGGLPSGEHGIGALKRDFLPRAVDPPAFELMRRIKELLDPQGIFAPGKVLAPQGAPLAVSGEEGRRASPFLPADEAWGDGSR